VIQGRTDSDLGLRAVPQPLPTLVIPLTTSAFPGYGNPVRQPNQNWGAAIGHCLGSSKNGKTVIRAGAGLFYENVIYNHVLFDRPLREPNGAFL